MQASITYIIRNLQNKIVYEESQTIPVETQTEIIKDFNTATLDKGTYSLTTRLTYEGQKEPAESTETFTIQSPATNRISDTISRLSMLTLTISLLLTIHLVYLRKHYKKPII